MSALGAFGLPKLDYICHADTQNERAYTYRMRDFYVPWFEEHGIPVRFATAGNIFEDGAGEHVHIPFWTETGGPLRRQCTRGYKIRPLRRLARTLAGYHPSNPPNPPAGIIEQWIGISLDEWQRMKDSRRQFVINRFPLVSDLKLTRSDCVEWLESENLPVPPKSACIICPYRSDPEWLDMKENDPADFANAVEFDERNRNNPLADRGSNADKLYLHRSIVPLAGVDLIARSAETKKRKKGKGFQMPLICDGFCHV